jgi:hypothetical protein
MKEKHHGEPAFDPEEIEEADPLGEQGFAESGFADAVDGGPDLRAEEMLDDSFEKRDARGSGQKVAGIPEKRQHEPNTPSEARPDSEDVVLRVRGGDLKGDPAAGGTRPREPS